MLAFCFGECIGKGSAGVSLHSVTYAFFFFFFLTHTCFYKLSLCLLSFFKVFPSSSQFTNLTMKQHSLALNTNNLRKTEHSALGTCTFWSDSRRCLWSLQLQSQAFPEAASPSACLMLTLPCWALAVCLGPSWPSVASAGPGVAVDTENWARLPVWPCLREKGAQVWGTEPCLGFQDLRWGRGWAPPASH